MITRLDFFELDPNNKTKEWINDRIREYRILWKPLVDPLRSKTNKSYLFGIQDQDAVKKLFKDANKANVDFTPKKVMEKMRVILVGDNEKHGIKFTVNALDPTAMAMKKKDRDLFRHRGEMEPFLSYFRKGINEPPFRLADKKNEDGTPLFSGNMEEFEKMGLDQASPEDVEHFMSTFYRLKVEIKAEEPINFLIKHNRMAMYIPFWNNDMIANKAMAAHTYVNRITGAIECRYLEPENTYGVWGKNPDGSDASCKGFEKAVSVIEFIRIVGNEFNPDTDMMDLLAGVNAGRPEDQRYTGVGYTPDNLIYGEKGNIVSPNDFLNLRVTLGYIEFKTLEGNARKRTDKNYHGNLKIYRMPLTKDLSPRSNSVKETYYREVTYKAYYIVRSSSEQRLYMAGPLEYQKLEGAEDERSSFSIVTYIEEGPSIVEIAIPYLKRFEKYDKKHEWLFNKIKGPGRLYNIDALLDVAATMIGSGTKGTDIMQLLNMFADSENELYTTPTINGQTAGGNGVPHHDLNNNPQVELLREFRLAMQEILSDIKEHIGFAPLRGSYQPGERDGFNLQMQNLQGSLEATDYLNRALMSLTGGCIERMMFYVQDVIEFREQSTRPYQWLLNGIGDQTIEDLKVLNKVCLHRLGMYIEPFNSKYERDRQRMFTEQAYQQKEIAVEDMLLIDAIESPKRAAAMLAYLKERRERNNQKRRMQELQALDQNDQKAHERRMAEIDRKGQWDLKNTELEGQYYERAQVGAADKRLEGTELKIEADKEKIEQKKEADIERDMAKN